MFPNEQTIKSSDGSIQENNKRHLTDNDDDNDPKKLKKTERIKKRNFALLLGYLGKDYYGMQRNPQMRTIEEDLIGAMLKAELIDQESFETIQYTHFQRAARTDKGVSATRQICSVKLPEYSTIEDINKFLPKQIRVFGLKRVTKGFNSKSQCNARTYTYTLPTYAFAPDDPSVVTRTASDEDILKRIEQLSVIDGKPYTDFRATQELLDKVNTVLKIYEGTHNFHNFTSKVRPFDPRAMRYIMKCHCLETHISNNVEFATVLIKGQSFMLHQIRKMMALAIGVIRNIVPESTIEECFKPEKLDIPIAPSLGLVLNHVHYDNYNRRYGSDGIHEKLEWDECDDQIKKFHKDFILQHIEETEINDRSMLLWLGELARCRLGQRIALNREEEGEEEEDEEESEKLEEEENEKLEEEQNEKLKEEGNEKLEEEQNEKLEVKS
ncbi:pseudouridylate synthase 1 homolog isoform X3 [Microplitis mediator]|nr:pseudouridylate synthase 1 homolog isoform X3 [Microplitis mediator]